MNQITKSDRIARERLRVNFADLRPGEKGYAVAFALKFDGEGHAYLRVERPVEKVYGDQPWPHHNIRGEYLVERLEGNLQFRLHVFATDLVGAEDVDPDEVEAGELVLIKEVWDHGVQWKVCGECQGAGMIKREETRPKIETVPLLTQAAKAGQALADAINSSADRWAAAFGAYATHWPDCPRAVLEPLNPAAGCTCGLDDVLDRGPHDETPI